MYTCKDISIGEKKEDTIVRRRFFPFEENAELAVPFCKNTHRKKKIFENSPVSVASRSIHQSPFDFLLCAYGDMDGCSFFSYTKLSATP